MKNKTGETGQEWLWGTDLASGTHGPDSRVIIKKIVLNFLFTHSPFVAMTIWTQEEWGELVLGEPRILGVSALETCIHNVVSSPEVEEHILGSSDLKWKSSLIQE